MSSRRHTNSPASVRGMQRDAENLPLAEPCTLCGKLRFRTRKAAKRALRRLQTSDSMSAYPCGDYWHIGHTPWAVRRGVVSRHEWQPR